MEKNPLGIIRLLLILACLCGIGLLYLSINRWFPIDRFHFIGGNTIILGWAERLRQAVYIVNYGTALLVLCLLPFIRSSIFFALGTALFGMAYALEYGFAEATQRALSFTDIFIVNRAMIYAQEAAQEFNTPLLHALQISALIIALLIVTRCIARQYSKIASYTIIAALCYLTTSYAATLYVRGLPALTGFPAGFSYFLGSAALYPANYHHVPSQQPNALASGPRFHKIVVIIDESILSDAMTGKFPQTSNNVSFTHAYSGSNCSSSSNYFLRRGMLLQDEYSPAVSLFALAKRAGYETSYYDNQNVLQPSAESNYFDEEEISAIDHVIKPDENTPRYDVDAVSLQQLKKALATSGKHFILINKRGAHFPYQETIPPDQQTADREVNYARSVMWNTKRFIDDLQASIDKDTVVFYTSDHGQNIQGPATHCGSGDNIPLVEWQVPMAVFSADTHYLSAYRKINRTHPLVTHFNFTESIRNVLGYDYPAMAAMTELSAPSGNKSHNICLHYGPPIGFFGRKATCNLYTLPNRKI